MVDRRVVHNVIDGRSVSCSSTSFRVPHHGAFESRHPRYAISRQLSFVMVVDHRNRRIYCISSSELGIRLRLGKDGISIVDMG